MRLMSEVCRGMRFFHLLIPLLLAPAGPALADADCTSAGFLAQVEDPAFLCEEVGREELPVFGGITLRTLLHKGDLNATISHEAVTAKVRTALQFMDAIPAGQPLKINDVTIVLMGKDAKNSGDTKTERVLGVASQFEGACILQLYPSRMIGEAKSVADELSASTAHELFHCVQHATWPELLAGYLTRPWVVEGTAEAVSQAVFPNIPEGLDGGFNFANEFRTKPLTQITYPNLVFFSWLWNQAPSRMFDVLSAIPGTGDEAAQQAALLTVVSQAELSQFVRDFLDGKVRTPAGPEPGSGGIPLIMSTNIGGITVDAAVPREVVSKPFTMFALDVVFSGGSYDVGFQNLGPIDWRHRQMQPRAGSEDLDLKGAWGSGGIRTESDCSEKDTWQLAGMAFGEAKLRLEVGAAEGSGEGCSGCGPTAARDQCLIGTWVIDNARMGLSLADYLSGSTNAGAAVKGNNALRFEEAGESTWGYDTFMIAVQDGVAGSPSIGAMLHGRIDQRWSASRGRLNTCFVGADALMTLFVDGAIGDTVDLNEIPRQSFEQYRYDCSEDGTLLIEQDMSGKPFLMRLHKLE